MKRLRHLVEPLGMMRAVGQRRQPRPAPLATLAGEHERVVLKLDAPLRAVHLDPVAPLLRRPRQEDRRRVASRELEPHRRRVLDGEGRVPPRLEPRADADRPRADPGRHDVEDVPAVVGEDAATRHRGIHPPVASLPSPAAAGLTRSVSHDDAPHPADLALRG